MFGGNIQYNRGGEGGTYQGGGGVQIPCAAVGTVRRRLVRSSAQYYEVKSGVGAAQEVTKEGGGGYGSIGKVLPHGVSGGALVWSGDMGDFGTNDADVGGIACGFPESGYKKKGTTAEGRVLAVGDEKNSPAGSGDIEALDICAQAAGDSGGVGGPTAYFLRLYERYGL